MPDPFGDNEALSQDALDALMNSVSEAEESSASPTAPEPDAGAATGAQTEPSVDSAASQGESEEDEIDPFAAARLREASSAALQMASFDTPADNKTLSELRGFERVQDIPLELTVELGRTRLLIKDILELRAGSIVELEKMAGEPVDILANGLLVARGEVVVIEDAFGVRITEIVTSAERKALTDDPSVANAA